MSSAFPDVRWGSQNSVLRRPLVAASRTAPGSWLIRQLTPLDRGLMTRTGGRFTVLGPVGAPTLLLTTTGRRSGLPRTSPLLYGRGADDTLIVVGSNFGQSGHPAWSGNLLAQPHAVVSMGGREIPVVATLLSGDAAEAAYRLMVETVVDVYAEYRKRTSREIRVFALRAESAPAA